MYVHVSGVYGDFSAETFIKIMKHTIYQVMNFICLRENVRYQEDLMFGLAVTYSVKLVTTEWEISMAINCHSEQSSGVHYHSGIYGLM